MSPSHRCRHCCCRCWFVLQRGCDRATGKTRSLRFRWSASLPGGCVAAAALVAAVVEVVVVVVVAVAGGGPAVAGCGCVGADCGCG